METQAIAPRLGAADYALRLFLVLHLAYASTLINLGGALAFRAALIGLAALTLFGIVAAFLRGNFISGTFSLAIVLMIVLQMFVFSNLSHSPVNWNVIYSFIPFASPALFFMTTQNIESNARFFIIMSVVYCFIYLGFGPAIASVGITDPLAADLQIAPKVLLDDLRGPRLFLSGGHAAAAAFAAWMNVFSDKRRRIFWLACFGAAIAAIVIANSRVLLAFFVCVFLLSLTVRSRKLKAAILLSAFVGATVLNLAGLFTIDWSVYQAFASDASGGARASSYSLIWVALNRDPIFGVGLPPDVATYFAYFGQPYIFWEDLGTLGIWATFGLLGMLVYTGIAATATQALRQKGPIDPYVGGVFLAAGLYAIYSSFLPDMMIGGSMSIMWLTLTAMAKARLTRSEASDDIRPT